MQRGRNVEYEGIDTHTDGRSVRSHTQTSRERYEGSLQVQHGQHVIAR
jgi:hypothetical protein